MGDVESLAGLVLRFGQGLAMVELGAIRRQSLFRLFQSLEHRRIELGESGVGAGSGLVDAGAGADLVGEAPAYLRSDPPAQASVPRQVGDVRGEAAVKTRQADAGVEVRHADADAAGSGRKP